MKTHYIFSALCLSILTLVSCDKYEIDHDLGRDCEKGTLTVSFTGDGDGIAKTSGTPNVSTEAAIKKGVIFIFRAGNNPSLDGKATFDFTSTAIAPVTVPITKGIRQIYVVANIDPANFTNINTLNDLYTITNKLPLTTFRSSGALAMSGFLNDVDLTNTSNVTVPLNFIGSRIHVDWDISNLNAGLVGNVAINGAAILNAKTMTNYLATPITSSTYKSLTDGINSYAQGYASSISFTGALLPIGAGVTNSYDSELKIAAGDKGFSTNYNYVFENNSAFPTIVTIYGTYNSVTYFWSVIINGAANTTGGNGTAAITRSNVYNVKATIKGLGRLDPYESIAAGSVDVSITTAAWNPVILINQDFN